MYINNISKYKNMSKRSIYPKLCMYQVGEKTKNILETFESIYSSTYRLEYLPLITTVLNIDHKSKGEILHTYAALNTFKTFNSLLCILYILRNMNLFC